MKNLAIFWAYFWVYESHFLGLWKVTTFCAPRRLSQRSRRYVIGTYETDERFSSDAASWSSKIHSTAVSGNRTLFSWQQTIAIYFRLSLRSMVTLERNAKLGYFKQVKTFWRPLISLSSPNAWSGCASVCMSN